MSIKIAIVSQFDQKGVKDAEAGLKKLSDINDKVFKAVAGAATLAAAGIAKFAADSIGAASDLAESTNAVNVAFGKSAAAVLDIGKNSATSLGLARTEFNQAAVRFSAFAERIAGAGGDTAKVIGDISVRAADFASVFNIEVSEAMATFQSGLAGEAEPLKRFGVNLLDAEVKAYALRTGIIGVGESMDETQKVQARFGLLMEATAKTAGDFANTSDGLANQQRILKAQFEDLQAEVGTALLPAFTDLVKAVGEMLMPRLKELGEFLNSPQGKKMIEETAKTVIDLAERFINLLPTLVQVGGGLLALTGSIKLLEAGFAAARIAAQLFSTTLLVTAPILGMVALIGSLTIGLTLFADAQKKAREQATGLTGRQAELTAEMARLKELLDSGVIKYREYQAAIAPIVVELSTLEGQVGATSGEFNRFNNMSFGRLKNELKSVSAEIMAMYHSGAAASAVFEGIIDPRTGKGVDFTIPTARTQTTNAAGGPTTGGTSGPSAFEQARERVRELIRNSQKQLADAQKTYNESVKNAREQYANNILQIEKDFANRLSGIIQASQDRLRSAYRSAVEENIAALFDRSEDKSVEGLVKSLSDKLAASRRLLENSAELASQGFSQTFIEQVVSAGTQTGNELAAAILNSTPETRTELQKLFSALESEANTGMDALAREIYGKQGLATQELKNLYTQTGIELESALFAQQMTLANALEDAATTLYDSVREIRQNFNAEIDEMGNKLGGMLSTVNQFKKALGETETKALEDALGAATMPGGSATIKAVEAAASAVNGAAGILIDSASDIDNVVSYLDDRIANAERYLRSSRITEVQRASALETLGELSSQRATVAASGASAVGTVININVKADTSQSLAMVGKSLGNTVAKYVTGGGQVIVSPI